MLGTQLNTFLAAFFQTTLPALQDTLLDSLPNAFLPALFQPALRECAHLSVLRGVELFVEPPLFGGQCEVGSMKCRLRYPTHTPYGGDQVADVGVVDVLAGQASSSSSR